MVKYLKDSKREQSSKNLHRENRQYHHRTPKPEANQWHPTRKTHTQTRETYRLSHEDRRAEQKPMPNGNMCSATCPLFRCAKKSLMVKLVDGKPKAFCIWVNDMCIGYRCQYALCFNRYLLPDGKCSAVTRSTAPKEDMFMEELKKSAEDKDLEIILSRKGLGKDLLY